jgi:CDP-diacylglycerol--glycerol-3-phosphate 3-phosphatidyltransferase
MYRHVPNLITITRLALTIIFFMMLNIHGPGAGKDFQNQMWLAFVLFVVTALTDVVDGYLARRWKVESAFGRVVDPFVDKILICGAFIFFSSNDFINAVHINERYATGVHPWMAVVLIAREFLITSIRGLAEAQGINFRADWAGKIKMFTQSFAIGAVLVDLALAGSTEWVRTVRDIAIWTTVIVTLLSAITYCLRARRIFTRPEQARPTEPEA